MSETLAWRLEDPEIEIQAVFQRCFCESYSVAKQNEQSNTSENFAVTLCISV